MKIVVRKIPVRTVVRAKAGTSGGSAGQSATSSNSQAEPSSASHEASLIRSPASSPTAINIANRIVARRRRNVIIGWSGDGDTHASRL
jgi:hypothetical protein